VPPFFPFRVDLALRGQGPRLMGKDDRRSALALPIQSPSGPHGRSPRQAAAMTPTPCPACSALQPSEPTILFQYQPHSNPTLQAPHFLPVAGRIQRAFPIALFGVAEFVLPGPARPRSVPPASTVLQRPQWRRLQGLLSYRTHRPRPVRSTPAFAHMANNLLDTT